jgi:protein-L-isoaspartate(D-aspartate) O-methyltransferase
MVASPATLRAMDDVPRDLFVPDDEVDHAFADRALPIACGQTISQPYVVARMTEALKLQPHHRVLEIGTGSGYQTAILARIARQVVSVERYRTLREASAGRLARLGITNVRLDLGDGAQGARDAAPFDRILVTCAVPAVPEALLGQLVEGGLLVAPVGPLDGVQDVVRLTKGPAGLTTEKLLPVRFVPLMAGIAREL